MKKIFLVLFLAAANIAVAKNVSTDKKLVVLDQVSAVVYQGESPDLGSKEDPNQNQHVIITQQDVARRGFDGQHHDLDDLTNEILLWQKAELMKMTLSDSDVDRQLDKMGMTKDQQVEVARRWNFADVDEFKVALKKMYVSNMSMGFETESGLVIPEKEVQAYFDKNPVWLEAEYEIQTGFVPVKKGQTKKQIKQKLNKLVKTGAGYKVAWEDPLVIRKSEVSSKNDFLTKLGVDQVHVKPVKNGFDLFKMVRISPRRKQPLSERKTDIVNAIRTERYPKVVAQVKKDLYRNSNIHYPKQFESL